ncbi:unnamed protein product, partial [Larinioides sclopetarius]
NLLFKRASVGSASVIVCYYSAVFTSEVQAVRRSSPCSHLFRNTAKGFAFGLGIQLYGNPSSNNKWLLLKCKSESDPEIQKP